MRQIDLISLKLRNFKGIKNFVLESKGSNTSVYGDNAVGKTTIFDSFTWLLFDKDSQNKKDFEIKTLDNNGKVLHNLEHEVEGTLAISGRRRTLRKVFTEKWTRKRGAATSEFTGHTTDYFIDGVPAKKAEYDTCVDEIVSENIFKLLTSPAFFNEQLKWQDRRKILLEVCGDISDKEVISSSEALSKLPAILGDRSIEDHRKVIAAKRAEINKELEKIPIRIDEANRSKPDVAELDEQFLVDDIATLKSRIQEKEAELVRVQSGGEVAVKEKRLREIEGELLQLKNQLQAGTMDKVAAKRESMNSLHSQCNSLQRSIEDNQRRIEQNSKAMERNSAERDRLREQHTITNAETFSSHHDENCPSCGQSLPEDQIKAAHDKAFAIFNRSKSERLEAISTQGRAAKSEYDRMDKENASLNESNGSLTDQLTDKRSEVSAVEAELIVLREGMTDLSADPSYINKQQEVEAIKRDILGLRSSMQDTVDKIRIDLAKVRNEVSSLEQDKAKIAQAVMLYKRIEELQQQEKQLAAEYEKFEHELFLTEEFIRTKVSLLESKINSKFKYARFKLFDQQINGGLAEVCETLGDGVPYSSGLNRAAQANIGLDIINTLSEHYGISAPIFIDNAEAVTQIMDTKGQQIRLIVSEKDKQLRVEDLTKTMQEAV
ncbi:hypothetical protein GC093_20630 [Paenibacillus sp. LMG 31456]|uniref:Nuclease SbcCD subunit C n=1 Tax=Paenibacillus foliorum TaxID=2654974 RepID=A0A972K1E3_9BACL|nr:hypothetical protein [Paenibacillus foliorum]NOU95616.1 hypothetical protein [Paenibacillus foliorum]